MQAPDPCGAAHYFLAMYLGFASLFGALLLKKYDDLMNRLRSNINKFIKSKERGDFKKGYRDWTLRAIGRSGSDEEASDAALEFSKLYWELVDLIHWAARAASWTSQGATRLTERIGVKPPGYGVYTAAHTPRPASKLLPMTLLSTLMVTLYAYGVYASFLPAVKSEEGKAFLFLATAAALAAFLIWFWYNAYKEVGVLGERADRIEHLIEMLTGGKDEGENQ